MWNDFIEWLDDRLHFVPAFKPAWKSKDKPRVEPSASQPPVGAHRFGTDGCTYEFFINEYQQRFWRCVDNYAKLIPYNEPSEGAGITLSSRDVVRVNDTYDRIADNPQEAAFLRGIHAPDDRF